MAFAVLGTSQLYAQIPSPSAGEWAVGSAVARFTVEVDKGSRPSPLTYAELKVPVPRWETMPIRVFNDTGATVGSKVLWSAPGEPLVLVFDSSSNAQHYDIYFGATDWPPLPLKDDHNGVLLETRAGDGKSVDHLPDMLDAWNKATTVVGRTMVPGVFEGGNRFGPQTNLLLHFTGWFYGAANEHLQLNPFSTDAAFVLVDGKEVVEWPGRHDWGGGMHGEHVGTVDVAPGLHQLDYYNAYGDPGGPPLVACLGYKTDTMEKWGSCVPDNTFFTPSAHAHVIDYAVQGSAAPPLALESQPKTQSLISHESTDIGFITLTLTCRPPQDGTVTWTFDDGTTAEGETVDHLFPRPGLRTVQAEVKNPTGSIAPVRQIFHVHPDWNLLNHIQPQLDPKDQADILARDPMSMSGSDLAGCAAVFMTYQANDALRKLEPAMAAKMKDIADADLTYIKQTAAVLAPDLTHAKTSDALLRALVDRAANNPALVAIASSTRLALAQLTLLTSDHTDEVKSLLAGVNVPSLTGEEHRAYDMAQADLSVATGDLAGATQKYNALMGNPGGPDARSSVRPTGRIGQARVFLDRKDTESAEDALNEVAQEAPIEKLSPDWALTRLRLYQDEKLPDIAYVYAQRLLKIINGGERSELLYIITDMAEQKGDHALAGKTLAELLQKHAYSEEAAKAKAKWPGGV